MPAQTRSTKARILKWLWRLVFVSGALTVVGTGWLIYEGDYVWAGVVLALVAGLAFDIRRFRPRFVKSSYYY
jgi:hypothetical protein